MKDIKVLDFEYFLIIQDYPHLADTLDNVSYSVHINPTSVSSEDLL